MIYSLGQVCECHVKGGFPWTLHVCLVCGHSRKSETLLPLQCGSVPLWGLHRSVCCIGGQFDWLAQGHVPTMYQSWILYNNLGIGTPSWVSRLLSSMIASTLQGCTLIVYGMTHFINKQSDNRKLWKAKFRRLQLIAKTKFKAIDRQALITNESYFEIIVQNTLSKFFLIQ